jgi:hypothetical protein
MLPRQIALTRRSVFPRRLYSIDIPELTSCARKLSGVAVSAVTAALPEDRHV